MSDILYANLMHLSHKLNQRPPNNKQLSTHKWLKHIRTCKALLYDSGINRLLCPFNYPKRLETWKENTKCFMALECIKKIDEENHNIFSYKRGKLSHLSIFSKIAALLWYLSESKCSKIGPNSSSFAGIQIIAKLQWLLILLNKVKY